MVTAFSSVDGQSTPLKLFVRGTTETALNWASIVICNSADKEINSFRSDTNGFVEINQEYASLTISLMGYEKRKISANEIIPSKLTVYPRSIRYKLPKLTIRKDYSIEIDDKGYSPGIKDYSVYQYPDVVIDSV